VVRVGSAHVLPIRVFIHQALLPHCVFLFELFLLKNLPFLVFLQVIVEVALRREGLLAPEVGAVVRLFSSVDPKMRLQIPFLIESALALLVWTDELLVP